MPIVRDYYGNESFTYGPYNVAREAALRNTAACLHIGKQFPVMRILHFPNVLISCLPLLADAYASAAAGK